MRRELSFLQHFQDDNNEAGRWSDTCKDAIFRVQRGSCVNQRHRSDGGVALNENRALQKDRTWSDNLWERGESLRLCFLSFSRYFPVRSVCVCWAHRNREVQIEHKWALMVPQSSQSICASTNPAPARPKCGLTGWSKELITVHPGGKDGICQLLRKALFQGKPFLENLLKGRKEEQE